MSNFQDIRNKLSQQSNVKLPSLELLDRLSFPTSLNRSTNKLVITPDIVRTVEADAHSFETIIGSAFDMSGSTIRVKTPESIQRKVKRHPDLRFQSVFNDIIGIRVRVPDYNIALPDYYRVVDMTNGKKEDDGYRAIHLYYKKSNMHYQVEVQLWSDYDWDFNTWTHICGYKSFTSEQLLQLRVFYEQGKIKTYTEYLERVGEICQRLKWI